MFLFLKSFSQCQGWKAKMGSPSCAVPNTCRFHSKERGRQEQKGSDCKVCSIFAFFSIFLWLLLHLSCFIRGVRTPPLHPHQDQEARRVKWLQALRSRTLRYEQECSQQVFQLGLQGLYFSIFVFILYFCIFIFVFLQGLRAKTLHHEKVPESVVRLQGVRTQPVCLEV